MNNYINNDKITALKVPFRGNNIWRQPIRGRVLLLALWLSVSPTFGQQSFDTPERKPFDSPALFSANGQLNKAPGGGIIPPPTEGDKVGAPVKDTIWILPLLAIGYGILRRRLLAKNEKIEVCKRSKVNYKKRL